jgi:DNA-binding NarL/FixJ family response regulator
MPSPGTALEALPYRGDNAPCPRPLPGSPGHSEGASFVVSVRIAVLDPLPMFRRGLVAALGEAGVFAEAPGDLVAWSRQEVRSVIFLTLESHADWQLLTELRQAHSEPVVIAILADVSVETYLRALGNGATAAIPRDASPQMLRDALEHVIRGMVLLPIDVIRALTVVESQPPTDHGTPSSRELDWLRELARGVTVGRLAEQSGYSERAMFRLLHDLYERLGVRTRTEALIRASEQGWL